MQLLYNLLLITSVIKASFTPTVDHFDFALDHHSSISNKCQAVPKSTIIYDCTNGQDLLTIKSITLNPNPPKRGKELSIKASAQLSEDVEKGATLKVAVKLGLIKLIQLDFDLCDKAKEFDLECPIKKGPVNITAKVDLPNEIPMGTFLIDATANTKDKKEITHLLAKLHFGF